MATPTSWEDLTECNVGGIHKVDEKHNTTNLEMKLIGFDSEKNRIRNTNGKIALINKEGNEVASWDFSSMLLHWNRKHERACYIPSLSDTKGERRYKFGHNVMLGTRTDFQLFLSQMAHGNIYYDPGIKLENMTANPKIKKRSQFRIKSKHLPELYKENEIADILQE